MSETINEFFHHLLPIFATIMLFVVGPKYISAVGRYFQHGTASMDTLVGLGSITAYIYSFVIMAFEKPLASYIDVTKNYYEAVIVVIGFIALGKYLEHRTMAKSGAAIKALLGLQAKKANRIEADGTTTEVDIQALLQGDIIQIKPGEKVPLDAEIITGTSDIDEAMITGESLPVSKGLGQQLI
jgi:Cu2+-exporting ATPase/Cu+-exporting ATPase